MADSSIFAVADSPFPSLEPVENVLASFNPTINMAADTSEDAIIEAVDPSEPRPLILSLLAPPSCGRREQGAAPHAALRRGGRGRGESVRCARARARRGAVQHGAALA